MLRRSVIRRCAHGHGGSSKSKAELGAVRYYSHMAWDGMRHMYHGFRLFGVNTKLAWIYTRKSRKGVALTRRERVLLSKATADLLRLVPFSFFVIVPFAEFLLPVALKMFPNLIPSTFETEKQGANKAFASSLRVSHARKQLLEYATTQLIAVSDDHQRVLRAAARSDPITADMIRTVAPAFADNGPLSLARLPPDILVAMGNICGGYKPWHAVLPHRVVAPRMKMKVEESIKRLKADDALLKAEGMGDLTRLELERACYDRGMRWVDTDAALLEQLSSWVDLGASPEVPYHTLFFFKPTANSLQRSMQRLPVDMRKKLLRIHSTLPIGVQESLQRICEKVDTSSEGDDLTDHRSTDSLARHVDRLSKDEADAEIDLGGKEVRDALAHYIDKKNTDELYNEILATHGKVTVHTTVEYVAPQIRYSTHIVSNLFDGLDMGQGSTPVTRTMLDSIVARCREKE